MYGSIKALLLLAAINPAGSVCLKALLPERSVVLVEHYGI
jgi:hypothetical protein